MRTQVTFDCADPHAQAAFWAAVFGSQVEDHSDLVDQLVAAGRLPAEDMTVIAGRSAFRDVAACSDPTGIEPRLFFQRVAEGKTSKNRVHLDVHIDEDRKTAEAERLVTLGAQVVDERADRGPRTIVMQTPRATSSACTDSCCQQYSSEVEPSRTELMVPRPRRVPEYHTATTRSHHQSASHPAH